MCITFPGGGSAYFNEKDKTIYVKGTEKNDDIAVTQGKDAIRVRINQHFEDFPAYNVSQVNIKSLDGDDIIKFEDKRSGSSLNNISLNIEGGDGNDVIYAGKGDDKVYGGKGDDQLYGEGGADYLDGGEGDDFLRGGFGSESKTTLTGGPGKDQTFKNGEMKPVD
jgi:Ca2+-binding RTX toxin-like protein